MNLNKFGIFLSKILLSKMGRKHKENLNILWFYLRWKLIENNETKK
jgi:hypothetical protein